MTVTPVKGQLLNRSILWSLTSGFSVGQSQRLLHSWHHLKTRQTMRAGWRCVGNSTGRSWPPTPASYLEIVSLKDNGNNPDIYQQQPENEQAKKWPINEQGTLLPSSSWAVLHIVHESNATRKIARSTCWKPLKQCSITPGTWLRLAAILSLNSLQFCVRKNETRDFVVERRILLWNCSDCCLLQLVTLKASNKSVVQSANRPQMILGCLRLIGIWTFKRITCYIVVFIMNGWRCPGITC